MTSYIQCCLVVGVIFCKLFVRKNKTFCLPKPFPMAFAVQDQQTSIEILFNGDFPVLCCADMQRAGALGHRHDRIFPGATFRLPRVQANHIRVEIQQRFIVDEIKHAQLEMVGSGKARRREMLVAKNRRFHTGLLFYGLSGILRKTAVILANTNRDPYHACLPLATVCEKRSESTI